MTKVSLPADISCVLKCGSDSPSAQATALGPAKIEVRDDFPDKEQFVNDSLSCVSLYDPRWLSALGKGLDQHPFAITAERNGRLVGVLPLVLLKSLLFGRHLVSLPYVNWSGVLAEDPGIANQLIDHAVSLADEHQVNYLEIRHETPFRHPALTECVTSKVHMRLTLPKTTDELWSQFKAKVRNQIRKAEKHNFTVSWGGEPLLPDFYQVFSTNMRDLGTPVYGKKLFASILEAFGDEAELCLVKLEGKPVAAALLVHSGSGTEVPSASSLRAYNSTNANMLMYWHLLQRATDRQSQVFDFGRSSAESNTFRFKKQWGATPHPAAWQYYVRKGAVDALRPESSNFRLAVRLWQKLPLSLSRVLGPLIVRGIP